MIEELKGLYSNGFFDKCQIEYGTIYITPNWQMFLLYFLNSKVYIVPERLIVKSEWEQLDIKGKMTKLVLVDKRCRFPYETEIMYSAEEFDYAYNLAESYNLESPVRINGHLVYSMQINDDIYKRAFFENLEKIIGSLSTICTVGDGISDEYRRIASVMWLSRGNVTISTIESITEIETERIKEILWEMAKKGLVRLKEQTDEVSVK